MDGAHDWCLTVSDWKASCSLQRKNSTVGSPPKQAEPAYASTRPQPSSLQSRRKPVAAMDELSVWGILLHVLRLMGTLWATATWLSHSQVPEPTLRNSQATRIVASSARCVTSAR